MIQEKQADLERKKREKYYSWKLVKRCDNKRVFTGLV